MDEKNAHTRTHDTHAAARGRAHEPQLPKTRKQTNNKKQKTQLLAVKASFFVLYFVLKTIHRSCLSLISSPPLTSLYLTKRVRVASSFYHTPSICPPSPPALIKPHFAPLTRASFLRSLSVSLASIQRVKVEEEIDSKKGSHVMWRGTKENPGGLGRLSATHFIPHLPATLTPTSF